jgi:hypothetical protein
MSGTFVLPTSIAVYRYQQMKAEAIVNTVYQVTGEKTPAEHCLEVSKDPESTVELLNLAEDQAEIVLDLLEDLMSGGSIDEVYGPRGGVLCILLPTTSTDLDHVHQALTSGEESEEVFVNKPNELFSGLNPAQVWVGAGKNEMALADAYLPKLWEKMSEKEFDSPGIANTEWLGQLRLWSYNPADGFAGRVVDIIQQERNANLAKRRAIYGEQGISTSFVAPD